jgi:hypothetical protein
MIAVAIAVIAAVIAVTCGIVADSNHADTLTFLGLMVKTTAAQIFLAGAICTWALFASLWLLSVGVRRSKERGMELRLLKALRRYDLADAPDQAANGFASARIASIKAALGVAIAGLVPGRPNDANDLTMSASAQADAPDLTDAIDRAHAAVRTDGPSSAVDVGHADAVDLAGSAESEPEPADSTESTDSTESEPTIELTGLPEIAGLADFTDLGTSSAFGSFTALDHIHLVAEPERGRHAESGRFYRADPSN